MTLARRSTRPINTIVLQTTYSRILRWASTLTLWSPDVAFNASEDGMNVSRDLHWLLSFTTLINELRLDDNLKYLCQLRLSIFYILLFYHEEIVANSSYGSLGGQAPFSRSVTHHLQPRSRVPALFPQVVQ